MDFSRFQLAAFDAYQNTEDNLSLIAVAGSGKSTTLAEMVRRTPHHYSVLVMAFNKDIVKDLTPRMASHPMCQVKTFNSFGFGIVRNNMRVGEIVSDKSDKCLRKVVDDTSKYYRYRSSVSRLFDLFRANLLYRLPTNDEIENTADEYSVELPVKTQLETMQYFDAVRMAYENCLNWPMMDFRDQVFRPIHHGMVVPRYDVVFVDEDQDLDRNQAELVIQAAGRLIMVGDPEQAIYRFRGAMANAVQELETRTKAVRFPLSVCYRCPRSVVGLAQAIVPQIEHCDWAPEGDVKTISVPEFRNTVAEGALVLCRCVKPLVTECLGLIRMGKKAKVKGREIGDQLKTLVNKVAVTNDIGEFNIALNTYFTEQMTRLGRLEKGQQQIQLSDTVETIRVIAESCDTVSGIIAKIDLIFTDDKDTSGIILMTIHKSKGLENPNVFILAPELLPHPRAKKSEDRKVEMNLKYVAMTRTKFTATEPGTLYFVRSDVLRTESTPLVKDRQVAQRFNSSLTEFSIVDGVSSTQTEIIESKLVVLDERPEEEKLTTEQVELIRDFFLTSAGKTNSTPAELRKGLEQLHRSPQVEHQAFAELTQQRQDRAFQLGDQVRYERGDFVVRGHNVTWDQLTIDNGTTTVVVDAKELWKL